MVAHAHSDLSTIASPAGAAGAVLEDLPVAQVIERTLGVSVTWGDDQGTTQPHNNLYSDYFVARTANGNEPAFKVFGSLLHCGGGTLTIQGTEFRIQVIHLKQSPATAEAIEPSVWHALVPSLLDRDIPKLVAVDEKADKQGIKRKMFELDIETKTANRDRKKRRTWKASHKPVAVPAPGTKFYQGPTKKSDLFIRESTLKCFEIMWKAVEGEKEEWIKQGFMRHVAFIVTGPPGLGKSWSSNAIVWQLLKKCQNIWFHSASDHTLTTFVFEGNAKYPSIADRPEGDVIKCKPPEGTWFLYDSAGGSSGTADMIPFQKQNVGVPCVIFSSPKDTNYKQGTKRMSGGLVWHLWTPSWEWHELEAVMPSMHKEAGGARTEEEFKDFIHALYRLWGGIPFRFNVHCDSFRRNGKEAAIEKSRREFHKELHALSRSLVKEGPAIHHTMLDEVGQSGESEKLSRKTALPSWLIFPVPIDSAEGPFRNQSYKFCSQQAEMAFLRCLEEEKFHNLKSASSAVSQSEI